LIPLAIFAYNRPEHLSKVLDALALCHRFNEINLNVFIDGAKSEFEEENVKKTILKTNQFASHNDVNVFVSKSNLGLARSIKYGVDKLMETNEKIIVLEDDILPSKYFLDFMIEGLKKYEKNNRVASIHGYLPNFQMETDMPFFRRGADCWGWATWRNRWIEVEWNSKILLTNLRNQKLFKDFNLGNSYCFTCMLERQMKGEIDSWAIRWHASMFLQNKLTLYPNRSLVINFGFDGSGSHGGNNRFYETKMTNERICIPDIDVKESKNGRKQFKRYYKKTFNTSFKSRFSRKIKGLITI